MRRAILLACALGAVVLASASSAGARAADGLVVIPRSAAEPALSYLKLRARPGHAVQAGTIELLNPTARTLRVALAPVDGVTLDTLGSSYSPGGTHRHGSTRWLALERRAVALGPRAHVAVGVVVRVPRGATSGDHLSGISVEQLGQRQASRSTGKGAATVSAVRYAIGVEVTLPGARHPLVRFTGAGIRREPAGLSFELKLRNTGNVILQRAHGSVRVTRDGRTVLSRPIPAGTFLAGTSIAYPVPAFGQRPREGTRYRVRATLRYPGGTAHLDRWLTFGHRAALVQQDFGGPPAGGGSGGWWKLVLVGAVLLYCLLTTVLLLRRRSRGGSRSSRAGVAQGADWRPR
ncbi:MAG TPA: hypothetical protein VHW67_07645 [Solirubrobacteraceae bacterium]|jgi:hypothetical protein|nr:hypothetical protein [Solirubrobacteraceae bacterium]